MDQKKLLKNQFLTFLNTDFENFDPQTPMQWMDLYNTLYPKDSISEDSYYNLFLKENIEKYFIKKKVDFNPAKNKSCKILNELDNANLAIVYFNFIQRRLKLSILPIIVYGNITSETAYPINAPVNASQLGSIIIKNSLGFTTSPREANEKSLPPFKIIEVQRKLFQTWEHPPEDFEILIWRSFYQMCINDLPFIQKLKRCSACDQFFISIKKSEKTCSEKKCKTKRQEQTRRISERKEKSTI